MISNYGKQIAGRHSSFMSQNIFDYSSACMVDRVKIF